MGKIYYKGFNRNLQCKNRSQYETGKEYDMDDNIECCEDGFLVHENPFYAFDYYEPDGNSRFYEVECSGKESHDIDDSKTWFSHIKIIAEIGIAGIIKAGVKFILDKVDWKNSKKSEEEASAATNTGYRSAAINTGDWSTATNTGNCSAATNTGNGSAATNTGDWSAATNTGEFSTATNTGELSAATNTGGHSAATNTGNSSTATNTGEWSAATNTGINSVAINNGDWSAATNTGINSVAINNGDWSAATNTGDCSTATNTGGRSAATNTGDWSTAINTGVYSVAINTGNYSSSNVSGKDSIAISVGTHARVKGSIGDWLVLADRDPETYKVRNMRCVLVDGKDIKEDTWYSLDGDSIVEASENDCYKEPMSEDDIQKLKETKSE